VREKRLILKISKVGCQIYIWPVREIMLILKVSQEQTALAKGAPWITPRGVADVEEIGTFLLNIKNHQLRS
jgi:hypothetical protein